MHRRPLVVLLCSLIAVAVAASLVSGAAGTAGDQPSLVPQTGPDGFDQTVFEIEVAPDGDARWIVQHSRPLADDQTADDFEAFAERFRTEELDAYQRFQVRAGRLTDQGTEVTGREMQATDFGRDAYVDELGGQRRGVIVMSFQWTNFATVENETVVVGDLFAGGFAITDGQRLRLSTGEGLAFDTVRPPPDSMTTPDNLAESTSLTWVGEREFANARPYAELVPPDRLSATDDENGSDDQTSDDGTDGTTGSDGAGDDTQSDDTAGSDGVGMVPVTVAGIVVLLGLAGGLAWYSRQTADQTATEPAPETPPSTDTNAPESAGPPPGELLTDEDRVVNLLEENDGRMKQVEIVERTDWSKSKVSMLLSDMEDDGQITKLRVGRENIISLAGEEPDAAGSPFDDE